MSKVNLLCIVGPTASGKTALAIEIAKEFKGSIICADSRTIYKNLDIGTAKPSNKEQGSIKHYGLNLIEPNKQFTAADFKRYAAEKVSEIESHGNLPIIVGGSGLYIDGYLYDFDFGESADINQRRELEKLDINDLQEKIVNSGYEMPENSKNKRYLIRAIEQGGINRSHKKLQDGALIIGLNPGIEVLKSRIEKRSSQMLKDGVVKEAEKLLHDYGLDVPGASGNIYRALKPYFETGKSIEECIENFKVLDWRLARRQLTWFRRNKDINWFTSPELAAEYLRSVL